MARVVVFDDPGMAGLAPSPAERTRPERAASRSERLVGVAKDGFSVTPAWEWVSHKAGPPRLGKGSKPNRDGLASITTIRRETVKLLHEATEL